MVMLSISEFYQTLSAGKLRIGYLWYGGIAIFTRSNSALYYLPMAIIHIFQTNDRVKLVRRMAILTIILTTTFVIYDFLWFGIWTFSFWNFINVNIFQHVSSTYGTEPFGWYGLIGFRD